MSVINITKENFETEVMESDKIVLIDFFADWCGPCRMVSPIIYEIAAENLEYKVCKINVESEPELAQSFQVSSIPTLAVVKNGELSTKAVGAKPKLAILEMLKSQVS